MSMYGFWLRTRNWLSIYPTSFHPIHHLRNKLRRIPPLPQLPNPWAMISQLASQ
jgi:hypothetical protein